jgi:DMSO/TMAO reductase YedYZ molybdopterin-dependent catalytic subunit
VAGTERSFTRAELLALPQTEVRLPIACVEGWSQMATWRGVRLRDLADQMSADPETSFRLISLEERGSFSKTQMGREYVRDPLTLVALELNGETLDLEHGYPARMIAPGRPGVLQTKWLSRIEAI